MRGSEFANEFSVSHVGCQQQLRPKKKLQKTYAEALLAAAVTAVLQKKAPPGLAVADSQKPIFYLVDWLPPDFGAVGQYATIFSAEMANDGREVQLIGLSSQAPGKQSANPPGGEFQITRLLAKPIKKQALSRRLAWTMVANCRLIWQVIQDKRAQNADVLFTGSPPFMLFFVFLCKLLRGCRLIYRITDFYPEVLFASWGKRPAFLKPFEAATWFFRRRVDEFQVLGEDQRKLLLAGGVRPERIVLKRDFCPILVSGAEKPAPAPPALHGRRILLYSGNYGVAHEIDTVIDGLASHHRSGSGRFGLWLNASGSSIKLLTDRLSAEGIPHAVTEPVPLEQLPNVLAAADAHLVSLRPAFSGYVLPSKIYGCLDSGRPILYVGPKSSDIHLLCSTRGPDKYEHVNVGDFESFGRALDRFAEMQ